MKKNITAHSAYDLTFRSGGGSVMTDLLKKLVIVTDPANYQEQLWRHNDCSCSLTGSEIAALTLSGI